jgi:hypothetical protein
MFEQARSIAERGFALVAGLRVNTIQGNHGATRPEAACREKH